MVANSNNAPIGVYDSGMGGLTVWREIRRMLPGESLVYLGDGANCPYGSRPRGEVQALADAAVARLVELGCKMVVVACNTATAAAIDFLREKYADLPIVGMEPAVKPACLATRSGVVGVLATERSLDGDLFRRTAAKYGSGIEVLTYPGTGFVELVEGDREDTPEAEATVRAAVEPMLARGADQIVLGCTHYPFPPSPAGWRNCSTTAACTLRRIMRPASRSTPSPAKSTAAASKRRGWSPSDFCCRAIFGFRNPECRKKFVPSLDKSSVTKMASKNTTSPNGRQNVQRSNRDSARWIAGLLLLFVGLFSAAAVFFSFFSWAPDQSVLQKSVEDRELIGAEIENLCGVAGARLGMLLVDRSFGLFGILIPVMLVLIGIRIIRQRPLLVNHSILSLFFIMILGSLTLGFAFADRWSICCSTGWGGAFGIEVSTLLRTHIGAVGTLILLLGGWILTGVFINRNFINKVNEVGNVMADKGEKIRLRKPPSLPPLPLLPLLPPLFRNLW